MAKACRIFAVLLVVSGPAFASGKVRPISPEADSAVIQSDLDPLRAQVSETDLPALKSALTYPEDDHRVMTSRYARMAEKPQDAEYRRSKALGERLSEQVMSWLLLADADESNPLLTPALARLRDSDPGCLQRLTLEVMEDTLRQIDAPADRRLALGIVFDPQIMNLAKWQEGKGEFEEILNGTRSALQKDKKITAGLQRNYEFLQSIWAMRIQGSDAAARRDAIDRLASGRTHCSSPVVLSELFKWVDLDATTELITNQKRQRRSDWKESIDGFVRTTGVPEAKIKFPSHDALLGAQFSGLGDDIEREHVMEPPASPLYRFVYRVPAFAYRPAPGMLLDPAEVPREFYRIYFDLMKDRPFAQGVMTPDSCLETYRLAAWGNFFGLKVPPVGSMRANLGLTDQDLKATYQMMVTMVMSLSSENPQWDACAAAVSALDQLWSYQIDLSVAYALALLWKDHRFTWESHSYLWGVIQDGSPDSMILDGLRWPLKALFYRSPTISEKIRYPEEWGGDAQSGRFAFDIPYPNGLQIEQPKSRAPSRKKDKITLSY